MQLLGQVCVSLLDEEPELLRDAHTTKARGNENWHGFQFILIGSRSRSRAPACPCSLVLYIYINLYVYIMYYRYLMTSSLCRTRQFPLFIGNVVYIYSPSGSASLIESWLVWYRRRGAVLGARDLNHQPVSSSWLCQRKNSRMSLSKYIRRSFIAKQKYTVEEVRVHSDRGSESP